MTVNQRVLGSSPRGRAKKIRQLRENHNSFLFLCAHNLHTTNVVGEGVWDDTHKQILFIENEIIQKETQGQLVLRTDKVYKVNLSIV
ncbi:hypothetical protein EZS27_038518 [termite gut metagenome]|uniref:Uncharacterized protein n=1 Tax=termite gut metagenome TaxID=433724 RepID=A0A5J4PLL7_9ZZZZ